MLSKYYIKEKLSHKTQIRLKYSRACGSYRNFLDRGLLLTRKLLDQGLLLVKLKSSLRKFYGRHLVNRYGTSMSQMTMDMFHLSKTLSVTLPFGIT